MNVCQLIETLPHILAAARPDDGHLAVLAVLAGMGVSIKLSMASAASERRRESSSVSQLLKETQFQRDNESRRPFRMVKVRHPQEMSGHAIPGLCRLRWHSRPPWRVAEPHCRRPRKTHCIRPPCVSSRRELDDLKSVCPRLDLFTMSSPRTAPAYDPATVWRGTGARPPARFVEMLKARCQPDLNWPCHRRNLEPFETVVLETIRDLGLNCRSSSTKVHDVLPSGVSKQPALPSHSSALRSH